MFFLGSGALLSTELAPRELAAGGLAAGAITGLAAVAGWPARSGGGGAAGAAVLASGGISRGARGPSVGENFSARVGKAGGSSPEASAS